MQVTCGTQSSWHRPMRKISDSISSRMGRAPGSNVLDFACVRFLPGLKRLIPCGSITRLNSKRAKVSGTTPTRNREENDVRRVRNWHRRKPQSSSSQGLDGVSPSCPGNASTEARGGGTRLASYDKPRTTNTIKIKCQIVRGLVLFELERALYSLFHISKRNHRHKCHVLILEAQCIRENQ